MNQPYVAYYRVSTDKQGQSGLGLEAQRQRVQAFVLCRGMLLHEYTEIESSRKTRPQLDAALTTCRQVPAILVIAKLDRLARNVAFISNLMESRVEFVAVDMPHASRVMLHIFAALAEHEREMISQRTREALAIAKQRGIRLGNPHPRPAALLGHATMQARSRQFRATMRPLIERFLSQGYSYAGIARELNARQIAPPRRGRWHAKTVTQILKGSDGHG